MARALGSATRRMENGEVVTKRLTAGSGRNDHDIVSRKSMTHGLCLMTVELFDAALDERFAHRRLNPGGNLFETAGLSGLVANGANRGAIVLHRMLKPRDCALNCSGRALCERLQFSKIEGQVHIRLLFATVPQIDASNNYGISPRAMEFCGFDCPFDSSIRQ